MKAINLFTVLLLVNVTAMAQKETVVEAVVIQADFPSVRDFSMSASGKEAYITVQSPLEEASVLVRLLNSNKEWTAHSVLSFSGRYKDLEPFLSHDDLRLYFASNRPLSGSSKVAKDFDIWYVERASLEAEWGTPINVGAPINTERNEFYPALAQNNNLYFTSDGPDSIGKDDLFVSTWGNNRYSEPVSLGEGVNTVGYEFNAYIAADESYLIFTGYAREDGFGSGDLYISYRNSEGVWESAINLGEDINSKHMDYCPFVDHGSNAMYFTSKRSSFSKMQDLKSVEDVIRELNKNENGLSSIYKVATRHLPLPTSK